MDELEATLAAWAVILGIVVLVFAILYKLERFHYARLRDKTQLVAEVLSLPHQVPLVTEDNLEQNQRFLTALNYREESLLETLKTASVVVSMHVTPGYKVLFADPEEAATYIRALHIAIQDVVTKRI